MNRKFIDLIQQTYTFPQAPFEVTNGNLSFHNIPLLQLLQQFGSPLKLTYLPMIGQQVKRSRTLFANAMQKCDYQQKYYPSYCTKSSHFSHIIQAVLAEQSQIELSSAFDTDIILQLDKKGCIKKDTFILCNGYKTVDYFHGIQKIMNAGFSNVIPIIDCMEELETYENFSTKKINIGLRVATEEEPQCDFYTSRFGISQSKIIDFYKARIAKSPKIALKMLHFFVYTGVQDSTYYWNELHKNINSYVQLKKVCPSLEHLNIGGGLPIKNSLDFDYNYQYMIDEIVRIIKKDCNKNKIEEPTIFSEFGTFTVGEASASLFQVLGVKQQNDRESWYIIDNSLITTLPDIWSKKQKFLMLPVNKWDNDYQRAILGGLTCDNDDYYTATNKGIESFMPMVTNKDSEPLYVGFFHTGAYQENLSGFGGVHHCLIPAPKHILIDRNEAGELNYQLFAEKQKTKEVLALLGY